MEKLKVSESPITEYKSLYEVLRGICNTITEHFSVDEISTGTYKEQVDWEYISNFIRDYSSEHDGFNIFPNKLSSIDDLLLLTDNIMDAYDGRKPFIQRTCMDCHRKYYIYISEKEWMKKKGYPLPKRCIACRKNRQPRFSYNFMLDKIGV